MPVSNSFRCVCKFVDRAAMHHKVNYIAPEGMSNGRQAIFDSSCLIFFFHQSLFFESLEIDVDEVLML